MRDGGAAFLGGCAGACAIVAAQHNNSNVIVATCLFIVTLIFKLLVLPLVPNTTIALLGELISCRQNSLRSKGNRRH